MAFTVLLLSLVAYLYGLIERMVLDIESKMAELCRPVIVGDLPDYVLCQTIVQSGQNQLCDIKHTLVLC